MERPERFIKIIIGFALLITATALIIMFYNNTMDTLKEKLDRNNSYITQAEEENWDCYYEREKIDLKSIDVRRGSDQVTFLPHEKCVLVSDRKDIFFIPGPLYSVQE